MIKAIDHIAVAVRSIAESLPLYTDGLGLWNITYEEVPSQKVRVAMIPVGESRIELLEPTSPDSPIAKYIAKHGEGMHHVTLRVDELDSHMQRLREIGVALINDPPVVGAEGSLVTFLHPKNTHGVLIELCRKKAGPQ
ncbi:MAG: methylmalonyl-CoA epimerase [bacterium]